ncbi:hypothetical protein [Rhizobium sp. AAP43]|uniref:hypothetical protein n=1 Tax=Rhizobium sp. AAP43 TaxID=1523420 RepID=UPI0012E16AED|nr:hypothetical protein [Rhizobium sp. AAP43]
MAQKQLQLNFINNTPYHGHEVFISFQNGAPGTTNFDVTYGNGKSVEIKPHNLMSEPLSLKDIGPTGLTINQAVSILVYVSYGNALQSRTSAPTFIGGGMDYQTLFQTFEITMTGNAGDQGDMTAINYFTAPMEIASYAADGTLIQSVGYTADANTIAAKLGASSSPPWGALVKDAAGDWVRFIGPSSYAPPPATPYQSFIPYLQSVHAAGQLTKIVNSNAFLYKSKKTQKTTNYILTLDHVATAAANGSLTLNGEIHTTITGDSSAQGPTFKECNATISAVDPVSYNTAIYGQVINSAVTFSGLGWSKLSSQVKSWDLEDQAVELTTQKLLIGEVTTGLLLGLINSNTVPAGQDVALKDMKSDAWWKLSPLPAFREAQPDHPYYNTYAAELFAASTNQVYSIPFSDRLGNGPLINTVSYNGQDVANWTVTLLPPLSAGG